MGGQDEGTVTGGLAELVAAGKSTGGLVVGSAIADTEGLDDLEVDGCAWRKGGLDSLVAAEKVGRGGQTTMIGGVDGVGGFCRDASGMFKDLEVLISNEEF